MASSPTADPVARAASEGKKLYEEEEEEEEKTSLHETKFVAPQKIDSAWDLTKVAHQHTLPEYDHATRAFGCERNLW